MRLTLIKRVFIGFSIVSFLLLCISGTAYFSQTRMAKQLELTSMTLTSLFDKTSMMIITVQNANRIMMEHANSTDIEKRADLKIAFIQSIKKYLTVADQLTIELEPFPEILNLFNQTDIIAKKTIHETRLHFDIQEQRVTAKNTSLLKMLEFAEEFQYFRDDLNGMISTG